MLDGNPIKRHPAARDDTQRRRAEETAGTMAVEATYIEGGSGAGKTMFLVKHLEKLLVEGPISTKSDSASDAADTTSAPRAATCAVLCPSPQAVQTLCALLGARGIPATEGVDATTIAAFLASDGGDAPCTLVCTPRTLALYILQTEAGRRLTGRDGRLATPEDRDFLFEDMKTSAMRPGRLREMMKFFFKSWTELADDDPAWLMTSDEVQIHTLLKNNLAMTRLVLEPEAANLARRVLLGPDAPTMGFDHVLVDDYQMLSRASQQLCCLLARQSIAVATNPQACVEVYDSYPYRQGPEEFLDQHADACVIRLEPRTARPVVRDCAFNQPRDEFLGIADLVSRACADGVPARDIAVAVPNGTWEKNVTKALALAGVAVRTNVHCGTEGGHKGAHGDLRDFSTCRDDRVRCALRLVADPHDAAALRAWCGYGDYLGNSPAFIDLRTDVVEGGMTLEDALERRSQQECGQGQECAHGTNAAAEQSPMRAVLHAYRRMRAFLGRVERLGLKGEDLVDEATRLVDNESEAGAAGAAGAAGTIDSRGKGYRQAGNARQVDGIQQVDGVAVLPYRDALGTVPSMLVVAGFVNGFIPRSSWFDLTKTSHDKRVKQHESDVELVRALAGKARDELVFTSFALTDYESAKRLDLKIDRIHAENGRRACDIGTSVLRRELDA